MRYDSAFLSGLIALIFWATSATFLASLKSIPALQVLIISLSICCLLSVVRLSVLKKWHMIRGVPWKPSLLAGIGLVGNYLCYYSAFQYASAVEIDLIAYSWPLLVFFVLILQKRVDFKWQALVALLIGFFGIFLICPVWQPTPNYPHALWGWGITTLGALCWILYTTVSQYNNKAPVEIVGVYTGTAVLLLLPFAKIDTWVTLDTSAWMSVTGLSVLGATLAYWGWDWAVKQDQLKRLVGWANLTPILSVGLLCVFGFAPWSWHIVLATLLLVASLTLMHRSI